MPSRPKNADKLRPSGKSPGKAGEADRTRLALSGASRLKNPDVSPFMEFDGVRAEKVFSGTEVECARALNFELPEDTQMAIELLEHKIMAVTRTRKMAILAFNGETGTYFCLNDEKTPDLKPRELTQISDGFMQDLLGTSDVIHSYLFSHDALIGIVAVGDRVDERPLDVYDEMTLEMLAPYLATKVLAFRNLKESVTASYVQKTALEISNRLIMAVDRESILAEILEVFSLQLGFEYCQYVSLETEKDGNGIVMMETMEGEASSYIHQGLKDKRRLLKDYAPLVSLLSSIAKKARNNGIINITGPTLGDVPVADAFGIKAPFGKQVISGLVVPLKDPVTGKLRGTLNLFRTTPKPIEKEALAIAEEVTGMISMALGRATVMEKALALASTDELTGLTNRRGFYNRFEAEIERARRNPTSLCAVLIDVDFFKQLNDTYGHLNGDMVLHQLAALFARSVRKSDVVCRFGGEEFALLLPDTTLKSAEELMDRIRKNVSKMKVLGMNGEEIKMTVSAGLAQVNANQGLSKQARDVISDSLSVADEQLYLAKESGRNRVCATCVPE